jgi:hypothetical protein
MDPRLSMLCCLNSRERPRRGHDARTSAPAIEASGMDGTLQKIRRHHHAEDGRREQEQAQHAEVATVYSQR